MEMNSFVNKDFLASFTGTLFSVELIVIFTKNLPIIKKIRTRIYTFLLAMIHIIIMGLETNTAEQTILCYYTSLINSLIITMMLCGGYDIIVKKIYSITKSDIKEENVNKYLVNNINENDLNEEEEFNQK